jgi:uncharacterized membrane protein
MVVDRREDAPAPHAEQPHHLVVMEILISRVLEVGVLTSACVVALGLVLFLVEGHSGYPGDTFPTTLSGVVAGVAARRPYAIIAAGLLLLILTPVIRVAAGIFAFLLEHDRTFVIATSYVLFVLIISFFLGRSGW